MHIHIFSSHSDDGRLVPRRSRRRAAVKADMAAVGPRGPVRQDKIRHLCALRSEGGRGRGGHTLGGVHAG